MADDKAKLDWTMLEAGATEPSAAEVPQADPLHAEPALAESPRVEPRQAGQAGKIVFHCSNGHRIVVAAKMGGQRGKCSKCGVAVRIPVNSESAGPPLQPSAGQSTEAGEASAAEPAAPETEPAAPEAEPAAPRATAPTATADQRPDSGSKVQAVEQEDAHAVGHSVPREDMFSGLVTANDSQVSATNFVGFSLSAPQATAALPESAEGGGDAMGNPTAALVARLFQEMEHGGIVEVHITGGSVILPEFYEPRWSAGSHGLFASRAADGTVTLTAVAWDSIQKIVVRQVEGLPDGMFE